MDDLQKEIAELKEFIAELKADRAAVKEKEHRESWTKYVSLTLVVVAVIAAIAAQQSGKYGGRSQMSQAQASDQWAFYQAKSIKQHLVETTIAQLQGSATGAVGQDEIKKLKQEAQRYDAEKAEIKAKAEALEHVRDDAGVRGGKLGLAISLFSVSIAVASVCIVTKKKPLWFASMALAALAVAQMCRAWF